MATRGTYEEAIRLYVETSGDKELGALAAQISKLGAGSDAAADQAQGLVAELDKLATTSNNIKQFTALKAGIAETGAASAAAKENLAALTAQLDSTDKPTKALEKSLARAATEVTNLAKQQNVQQVALQRTSGALRAAGVDTDKLAAAYADLQDEFGGFSQRAGTAADAMQRTAKEGKNAAAGVGGLDKAAKASSTSLAQISTRLLAVSGAAAAAIAGLATLSGASLFTGAIRSAATLEDALTQVRAVSGATADEMQQLKLAAEAAGAGTKFSTLEAAQALGELARATGDAQSAIGALPATLNLAAAAGIDVAEAANIVTTTLTQFGLGFEKASLVADLFAKEANSTQDTVSKLGLAMSYTAPLAAALGMTLEETTAILGALAANGFKGERAGTALRNVFSEMLDPASDFAKALRDSGIESKNFGEIIQQLADKGDVGRAAILKLDAEARPAILRLVDGGGAKLRELQLALQSAGGEAERTALQMRDTLGGAAESFSGSFDRLRRELVDPLLEPLRHELSALSVELEEFAKSPEFAEIKTALSELFLESAAAARELIKEVDFKALAQNIRQYLGEANESLASFRENLSLIVSAVTLVGNSLSVIFNGLQATVLLFAATFAKVVSGIAHAVDFLSGPQRAMLEFFGIIKKGQFDLSEFGGGMNAVGDEMAGRFVKNLDEAITAAQRLAGAAPDAVDATSASLGIFETATESAAAATDGLAKAADGAAAAQAAQATAATEAAASNVTAADATAASAERVKAAFADMGISSERELRLASSSAKRNFEIIRDAVADGGATANDAITAFQKYAEAARAAVVNSDEITKARVENEIRVAQAGLQVNGVLADMANAGRHAGDGIAEGADKAALALSRLGKGAAAAGKGAEVLNDGLDDASRFMGKASKEGQKFALANYAVSDSAAAAYMSLNKFAGSGTLWRSQINGLTKAINDQGKALNEQIQKLQEANGAFDELAGRRKELAAQYDKLGAGDIERLLQAEQQLEANRKRAADEQQRQREEAIKAVQAAQEAGPAGIATAAGTSEAAAAVGVLLDTASTTANAIATAASQLSAAPVSGELVIRLVSEAAPGAQKLTLSHENLLAITAGVSKMLRLSKSIST